MGPAVTTIQKKKRKKWKEMQIHYTPVNKGRNEGAKREEVYALKRGVGPPFTKRFGVESFDL